mgnify:CR=1 FL=1
MIIKKNIKKSEEDLVEEFQQAEPEPMNEGDSYKIDLFDLDNIDFKQRQERRRGDRRRGFRRIDDRNLISRAREEAVTIREAAAKEGYEQGLARADSDIAQLKSQLINFAGAQQAVFDRIAPEIMAISIDIAKKIIKTEVQQNPELIIANIQQCLRELSKEETKVMLKLNPADVANVKQQIPTLIENAGLDVKVMIIPDPSMTQGGGIIQTTNGIIDVTIDTQVDIVTKALREM